MWLCAALVVVFGLPLAFLDDMGWRNTFGGLSASSLGLFAFAMAGNGLATGQIRIHFSVIHRARQPRLFGAAIGLVCAAGTAVVSAVVWALIFKAG